MALTPPEVEEQLRNGTTPDRDGALILSPHELWQLGREMGVDEERMESYPTPAALVEFLAREAKKLRELLANKPDTPRTRRVRDAAERAAAVGATRWIPR